MSIYVGAQVVPVFHSLGEHFDVVTQLLFLLLFVDAVHDSDFHDYLLNWTNLLCDRNDCTT